MSHFASSRTGYTTKLFDSLLANPAVHMANVDLADVPLCEERSEVNWQRPKQQEQKGSSRRSRRSDPFFAFRLSIHLFALHISFHSTL